MKEIKRIRNYKAGRLVSDDAIQLLSFSDGNVYSFDDDGSSPMTGEPSQTRQNLTQMVRKLCHFEGKDFPLYRIASVPKILDDEFDRAVLKSDETGDWKFASDSWKAASAKAQAIRNGTMKEFNDRAAAQIAASDVKHAASSRKTQLGAS